MIPELPHHAVPETDGMYHYRFPPEHDRFAEYLKKSEQFNRGSALIRRKFSNGYGLTLISDYFIPSPETGIFISNGGEVTAVGNAGIFKNRKTEDTGIYSYLRDVTMEAVVYIDPDSAHLVFERMPFSQLLLDQYRDLLEEKAPDDIPKYEQLKKLANSRLAIGGNKSAETTVRNSSRNRFIQYELRWEPDAGRMKNLLADFGLLK